MKVNHNAIFKYYQKGIYDPVEKLYAIGDIHGDFNAFINVLKKAQLINNEFHWIGGKSHVVQVGDILDRKPRDLNDSDEDSEFKIISLILKLQLESYVVGGGFHPIIGNHEIMNILGMFDYVSKMGMNHFNNIEERANYFKIGNDFCKYLACAWNPIVKIGDFIFCHGGISSYISDKYSITQINSIMRDTLYGNAIHLKNPYFSEIFLEPESILWNRDYSSDLSNSKYLHVNRSLNKMLNKYNAKYLVVGHTPQLNGIKVRFNGKVICVDTAMSEAFGAKIKQNDRIHYLEIIANENLIHIY